MIDPERYPKYYLDSLTLCPSSILSQDDRAALTEVINEFLLDCPAIKNNEDCENERLLGADACMMCFRFDDNYFLYRVISHVQDHRALSHD